MPHNKIYFYSLNQMKLFIVATPIGNLEDVTYRAVRTLKEADLILCEDTRITSKLLNRYKISKPLLSYHQRSKLTRTDKIIEHLESGKNLALVTDAGTPGISDPGNELVGQLLEHFGKEIEIIPIPGPSALVTLVSVSGVNLSRFVFLGFAPNKKGRESFFKKIIQSEWPVIYYDSPYRFIKNLELISRLGIMEKSEEPRVVVGRELTKIYEEIKKGKVSEILGYYKKYPDKVKGEFVVIIV